MEGFYCLLSMGFMALFLWAVIIGGTIAGQIERRREEDGRDR